MNHSIPLPTIISLLIQAGGGKPGFEAALHEGRYIREPQITLNQLIEDLHASKFQGLEPIEWLPFPALLSAFVQETFTARTAAQAAIIDRLIEIVRKAEQAATSVGRVPLTYDSIQAMDKNALGHFLGDVAMMREVVKIIVAR